MRFYISWCSGLVVFSGFTTGMLFVFSSGQFRSFLARASFALVGDLDLLSFLDLQQGCYSFFLARASFVRFLARASFVRFLARASFVRFLARASFVHFTTAPLFVVGFHHTALLAMPLSFAV
jgi:hypothetical protein